MPTGYAMEIQKGISFEQFALRCAHAFGACIELRDEPLSAPIPEFKPSTYHVKEIAKAKRRIASIEKMDTKGLLREARKEYDKQVALYEKFIREAKDNLAKYQAMLKRVNAWEPPTADHMELKRFMAEQIESSISHDCDTAYWQRELDKQKMLPPEQWKSKELKELYRSLSYHTEENQKEIDRTNRRNEWVRKLRESLAS